MSAVAKDIFDVDNSHSPTVTTESLKVRGEALADKVKGLLREGNVQRILVKNDTGRTVIEIPVTAGIVAAVIAPVLTGVAAIAALANDWQIEVHRDGDEGAVTTP
jgi:hypothetical protein